MIRIVAVLATIMLGHGAAAAESMPSCDVPESLIPADYALTRVANAIKDHHRLQITVVGSGSSALSGPDGARLAYPARVEEALRARLPGHEIAVTTHIAPRETTAENTVAAAPSLDLIHPGVLRHLREIGAIK